MASTLPKLPDRPNMADALPSAREASFREGYNRANAKIDTLVADRRLPGKKLGGAVVMAKDIAQEPPRPISREDRPGRYTRGRTMRGRR